jgi:hypothetical protein
MWRSRVGRPKVLSERKKRVVVALEPCDIEALRAIASERYRAGELPGIGSAVRHLVREEITRRERRERAQAARS